MLTFIDLFAGVGGIALGFVRAGMVCNAHVEIESNCCHVLRRHFPDHPIIGDICGQSGRSLPPSDVICFGSPCQDLSVAGQRKGLAGERSGLFFEAMRIIREMREATDARYPTIAVWENVCGAFSSDAGADFASVLGAFRELRALDIGWSVLDARWHGVAQRRRRVFVVADFGGQRAEKILSLSDRVRGYPAPRAEAGQRVAACLTRGAQSGGRGEQAGRRQEDDFNIVPALCANGKAAGSATQQDAESGMLLVAFGGNDTRGPIDIATGCNAHQRRNDFESETIIAFARNQRDELRDLDDCASCLSAEPGTHQQTFVAIPIQEVGKRCGLRNDPRDGLGVGKDGDPVFTLQSGAQHGVGERQGVRRLTPRECERLQGFPDDWTQWGMDESGKRINLSDAARYTGLGNAVCVNVAEHLGRQIVEALQ
jgi:DNA (cytosine-5)-methyltransferase 1